MKRVQKRNIHIFYILYSVFSVIPLYSIFYILYPLQSFAAPPKTLGEQYPGQGFSEPPITDPTNIVQPGGLLTRWGNWFIMLFWIVAVAFIVWAAFTFLTANGEEDKITLARKRVQYAVIAAIIAALATGIDVIVYWTLRGII